MSGYDATSRDAFARVDITAGQARVLSAFKPGAQHTRQELVALTGMPINAICGRCKELLDAGTLESLEPINGRHPLRIKHAPHYLRDGKPDLPAGVASHAARDLIAIHPFTGYMPPMSIATARRIVTEDKANAFYEIARKRLGMV